MFGRARGIRGVGLTLAAGIAVIVLAACGSSSSSGNAQALLKQTFSGTHAVNSGNLTFSVTVTPTGSSSLIGPITISLGGPFQSLGKGKLPKSDFSVGISALGHTGSLAILSTGTAGYVTLQGTSYRLPTATFQKLESSFSALASGSGAAGGSGALGKLGIDPLRWLNAPTVVGNENVGGATTTHISAGIDVRALLRDLNTFLGKASSVSAGKIPSSISPTTQTKIASQIQNPSFDVWTGTADKTVRRLVIGLTLPVSGQISTLLGGLSSAAIKLTLQYADLNRPQTIVAPTNLAPYSQFTAKLDAILQEIDSAVSSQLPGSSTSSGSTTTGSTSNGSGSAYEKYSQCIVAAHNDVAKMTKCTKLLNGG
jgi:hypothetical protein